MRSNGVVPLDYVLFRPLQRNKKIVDANTLLHYTNVFNVVVYATCFERNISMSQTPAAGEGSDVAAGAP